MTFDECKFKRVEITLTFFEPALFQSTSAKHRELKRMTHVQSWTHISCKAFHTKTYFAYPYLPGMGVEDTLCPAVGFLTAVF